MERNGGREMKCCICGREIKGWGNNPWPVNNNESAKCCDECNGQVVIPARIRGMYKVKGEVI